MAFTYADVVAALYATLDAGVEPTDAELEALSEYKDPNIERDLAQLFYRRALVREERLEREEQADFERRRRELLDAEGLDADELAS